MKATLSQQRWLRRVRWIILLAALGMIWWMNRQYAFVRPNATPPGIWSYSGSRITILERFDQGELPDRGRVVVFLDSQGKKRLGRVIGWPGDAMEARSGVVYCRGERTVIPVDGESISSVPPEHLLLSPDEASIMNDFGPPMMPWPRIVGAVVVEFLF